MSLDLTLWGYAMAFAGLLACEVIARRTGRVATFAAALGGLARFRLVRLATLVAWLWVGWHIFVRAHH